MYAFHLWLLPFSSVATAAELPSVDAPLRTGAQARGDAAVVIGIEDYGFLPDAVYATRDAEAFYNFLVYTRGIPSSRVNRLPANATRGQVLAAVAEAGELADAGGTAWVYFAGHGAASPSGRERMLLPSNTAASEAGFDETGILVKELQGLAGQGGGEVMVVTDACFTGAGRDGGMLLGSGRSWVPPTATASGKAAQWDAVVENQVARPLDGVGHGAFTYFALGALRGWADGQVSGTPDGVVTGEEAQLYVQDALRSIGMREQTPSLVGKAVEGRVLATIPSKVREAGPDLVAAGDPRAASTGTPGGDVWGTTTLFASGAATDYGQRLREQQCDDVAEQEATRLRQLAIDAAVSEVRESAAKAWGALADDVRACPQLRDAEEREACIRGVEQFVETAGAANASVPAHEIVVDTPCGPRSRVFAATAEAVEVAQVREAADAARVLRRPAAEVVVPSLVGGGFSAGTLSGPVLRLSPRWRLGLDLELRAFWGLELGLECASGSCWARGGENNPVRHMPGWTVGFSLPTTTGGRVSFGGMLGTTLFTGAWTGNDGAIVGPSARVRLAGPVSMELSPTLVARFIGQGEFELDAYANASMLFIW